VASNENCDRTSHGHVDIHHEVGELLERFIDVAMPQRPFEPLQRSDDWVTQRVRLLLVLDRQGWTGEGHGAKQGPEGARVVLFAPKRLATVVTLGMGRDKGRRLPLDQLLLERPEDGLRFGQCEAQMLDPLVRLLHHRELLDLLFTTTLCTQDKLHLDLHGVSSHLGHID
jgi:hypothetical protein